MAANLDLFGPLFLHTLSFWWVIVPTIFLGLIVGAIPGFSAANTIIILLPLTLVMEVEVGLVFMVALYCSSRMGAGWSTSRAPPAPRRRRSTAIPWPRPGAASRRSPCRSWPRRSAAC
jgi:hypothetical protein